MKVSLDRVRIPDLVLIARTQIIEQALTKPPPVIEILSPEDRIQRYSERLADYRRMGVQNIWVIDPANRLGYDCSTTAWLPVEELRVPRTAILLPLGELWRELDTTRE